MAIVMTADLAERIEHQRAESVAMDARFLATLVPDESPRAIPLMGGSAALLGPRFPVNRGIALGFAGPVTSAEIDTLEDFYHRAGMPVEMELCPYADSSLLEEARRRRYRFMRFYQVYLLSLATKHAISTGSHGIHTHMVAESEREIWARVVAGMEPLGMESSANAILLLARATAMRPDMLCLLATLEGAVAGAAALAMNDGLGMCSFMSTLPAFRGRGVQQTLLAERLAIAHEAGCAFMQVCSHPATTSQRNIQRMGFEVVYTNTIVTDA